MDADVLFLRSIWRIANSLTKDSAGGFDADTKPHEIDQRLSDCYLLIDELEAIVKARERMHAASRDLDGFKNGPL